MLSASDFQQKQIVFALCNEGEKIAFSNDNLLIKTADGKIKLQCTCYRLFLVYIVGHYSVTSDLIAKAQKFGFFLVLMSGTFRCYDVIGARKDGNVLLREFQYQYTDLEIAKHIIKNKIANQRKALQITRNTSEAYTEAKEKLKQYIQNVDAATSTEEIMGYEGLASRMYFKNLFCNVLWNGRQPRIKKDPLNATLDIGYTLLFTFIDSLTACFGFDTYRGFLHKQFYMRKSLICDFVEPFRPVVDMSVRKAIHLRQWKAEDFLETRGYYRLKYEKNGEYISSLMKPLIDQKENVFNYVQQFYRAFMKHSSITEYPAFQLGE